MADFPWSFAMVQNFFVWRYEVPDSRRTALRGKLQNLQKFGIPSDVNTGRGRPAKYGLGQIIELSIAMEMMDLGFPPDSVVTILRSEMTLIMEALNVKAEELPKYYGEEGPRPALIVISAFAKSHFFPRRRSVQIMTPNEFAEGLLKDDLPVTFPVAIIDLQKVLFQLKDWFAMYHPNGKRLREFIEERAPGLLDNAKGQSK